MHGRRALPPRPWGHDARGASTSALQRRHQVLRNWCTTWRGVVWLVVSHAALIKCHNRECFSGFSVCCSTRRVPRARPTRPDPTYGQAQRPRGFSSPRQGQPGGTAATTLSCAVIVLGRPLSADPRGALRPGRPNGSELRLPLRLTQRCAKHSPKQHHNGEGTTGGPPAGPLKGSLGEGHWVGG